jgi:hypothetical protein
VSQEDPTLPEGLYEAVVTRDLGRALQLLTEQTPSLRKVDEADLPHVLTRHIASAVEHALVSARGTDQRLAIANDLLEHLNRIDHQITAPPSQLLRLAGRGVPGTASMTDIRPSTP